jgi:hypothetical protein
MAMLTDAMPSGILTVQGWFKSSDNTAAGVVSSMTPATLTNGGHITPVAFGTEGGILYAEFKVTSFSTFGYYAKTKIFFLPITLTSFTATPKNNTVVLKWDVATEVNVKQYEVLYSTDGINFIKIGTVPATGSQAYSYVHSNPATGINYYRIKAVDIDAGQQLSDIRLVRFGGKGDITIFPNPATSTVNIQLPTEWQQKAVRIDVINQLGQVIQSKSIANASQIEIVNTSNLPKGVYTLRIVNSEAFEYRKLMVE